MFLVSQTIRKTNFNLISMITFLFVRGHNHKLRLLTKIWEGVQNNIKRPLSDVRLSEKIEKKTNNKYLTTTKFMDGPKSL